MKKETSDKKKKIVFWLSKYHFYLSIFGIITFGYIAFDSVIKKEWFDVFMYGLLGVTIFAIPLYEVLKKR
ncbi:hypothetical protein OAC17_03530 [Flavobacteriaceae bacterium]|nr:hypothetical protein [Flavobacteriaceae bacterium]MDB9821790.1 hypothetical protein [Flavobacteriaceae bacterium]